VLDPHEKVLGCIGLDKRISSEVIAGWAGAKQRPFEDIAGDGG
jgi:hypothetical protein